MSHPVLILCAADSDSSLMREALLRAPAEPPLMVVSGSEGCYVWPQHEQPVLYRPATLEVPPDLIEALHEWGTGLRPEPRNRHERRAHRHHRRL